MDSSPLTNYILRPCYFFRILVIFYFNAQKPRNNNNYEAFGLLR